MCKMLIFTYFFKLIKIIRLCIFDNFIKLKVYVYTSKFDKIEKMCRLMILIDLNKKLSYLAYIYLARDESYIPRFHPNS